MSALRPCCRPRLCPRLSHPTTQIRQATATSYNPDHRTSTSSGPSSSHSYTRNPAPSSDPRKGKGTVRSDSLAQTYRFPEKGRLGGYPDPYEVMALDRGASEQTVKQQYYKLALLLHPDSSHPSSSHDHFSTLNKAYTLLSTPSSRKAYLKTGYGWTAPSQPNPRPPADYSMHAEIMRRSQGGTSGWDAKQRQYRDSDAGRGAWGGFDGSQGWKPYANTHMGFDQTATGTGEERYMSNPRFLAVVGIVGAAMAWMQYHRLGSETETHRQLLDRQNTGASHALAQARYEAAIHGKTRREQIRRRVREAEVLKELEKIETGQIVPYHPGQH
ncbi:hypothetical protein IAU60_001568 [Kwoniella sp. DSM 27419]